MEDYRQKYDNALKVIAQIRDANYDNKALVDFIEYNYPELKESEDEKIRNEIIQSIQDNMCVIHKDKCIAWLKSLPPQPRWRPDEDQMKALQRAIDRIPDINIHPSLYTLYNDLKEIK